MAVLRREELFTPSRARPSGVTTTARGWVPRTIQSRANAAQARRSARGPAACGRRSVQSRHGRGSPRRGSGVVSTPRSSNHARPAPVCADSAVRRPSVCQRSASPTPSRPARWRQHVGAATSSASARTHRRPRADATAPRGSSPPVRPPRRGPPASQCGGDRAASRRPGRPPRGARRDRWRCCWPPRPRRRVRPPSTRGRPAARRGSATSRANRARSDERAMRTGRGGHGLVEARRRVGGGRGVVPPRNDAGAQG